MALSLQTKLFTAFLIPPLFTILYRGEVKSKRATYIPALPLPLIIWCSSLFLTYTAVTTVFFHFNYKLFIQQLIIPHLKLIYVPGSDFSIIIRMLFTDYDTTLLALMGILWLIYKKTWKLSLPILWLTLAVLILTVWHPVWYHYYLLVSLPLSWLAAISIGELWYQLRTRTNPNTAQPTRTIYSIVTGLLLITSISHLPYKCDRVWRSLKGVPLSSELYIVKNILKYKPYTRWMVTDMPIFAFYAGIPVIPELVLIGHKRSFTDNKGQKYFLRKLKEYKPELILLSNYFLYNHRKVLHYIDRNYSLTHCFKTLSPLFTPEISGTIPVKMLLYVNKNTQHKTRGPVSPVHIQTTYRYLIFHKINPNSVNSP